MAGSRLQRIGTIFSRTTGLLKAGAMKEDDKPLWYDVYKAFPPKYEPTFSRPAVEKEMNEIFYLEDIIRAKFCKKYGSPGLNDLMNPKSKSITQKFVEKYQELEKTGKYSSDEIFEATEAAFAMEGISLEKEKLPKHSTTVSESEVKRLINELKAEDLLDVSSSYSESVLVDKEAVKES